MANGYSLGILQTLAEVAKNAAPQYKIEPVGLAGSLYTVHTPRSIGIDSYDGHKKVAKIKRKQRFTPAQTSTSKSCTVTNTQPYLEETVAITNTRQIAIHMEDEVMAQFDKYASANKQVPGSSPMTSLMWEHWDSIMTAASALMQAKNGDLVTLAAAAVGVNRATTNNTAQSINIPQASATNILANGVHKILVDFQRNTMSGSPIVIGSGNFEAWMMQQYAKSPDQAGLNSRIQAAGFDFFADYQLPTALGNANDILVYEKDSIQVVDYLEYQGFKAGPKPGASSFGVMPLPMKIGNGMTGSAPFDFQLRYNDCEEEFSYVDGEPDVVLQKGWNLILTTNFGLYTIPSTAYRSGDVLAGNRGSLYFRVTNT